MAGNDAARAEARQQFRAELLALLPDPDQEPVATTDLAAALRLGPYEHSTKLWYTLDQLTNAGLVERSTREGANVRFWRRAERREP